MTNMGERKKFPKEALPWTAGESSGVPSHEETTTCALNTSLSHTNEEITRFFFRQGWSSRHLYIKKEKRCQVWPRTKDTKTKKPFALLIASACARCAQTHKDYFSLNLHTHFLFSSLLLLLWSLKVQNITVRNVTVIQCLLFTRHFCILLVLFTFYFINFF